MENTLKCAPVYNDQHTGEHTNFCRNIFQSFTIPVENTLKCAPVYNDQHTGEHTHFCGNIFQSFTIEK